MKKNKILLLILGLTILSLGGFLTYKFKLLEKVGFINKKENEVETIMKRISEVMILPDEIPTVATITDKSKFGNQLFFQKAENGDKLLLFTNSNLAILYRDSIGKIIEISQISVANSPQIEMVPTAVPTTATVKEDLKIKVALYNGSQKAGQTTKFEKEILDKIGDFEVVKKADAKNNYEKSLVVDISGNYSQVAKSLADKIGGEMAPLPAGEVRVETDLLIIIGENWE